MQIRRLCESLTDDSPKSTEMEAFLAHPNHVLARLSRDISQKDVIVASFEKPMQVPLLSGPSSPAFIAAHSACSALLDTITEGGNLVPKPAYPQGCCCWPCWLLQTLQAWICS